MQIVPIKVKKSQLKSSIILADKLAFENEAKEKQAEELMIANKELIFQNKEKEKRASELTIANRELAFQNGEKEKWAAELIIANKELLLQNEEKEKLAAELIIANKELAFQNEEKEKRAAEVIIANKELVFQNKEKGKRASELIVANKELAFQNGEKEKRAAELIIANKELAFQNEEKEKLAAELLVANTELIFQNEEKEKRASELFIANKELEEFAFIASHDLQEPLRKIQIFSDRILTEGQELTDASRNYLQRMQSAGARMQQLVQDLLSYSRINENERKFEKINPLLIVEDIKFELKEIIEEKNAVVMVAETCEMDVIPFQFRQLLYNLISNALKFASTERTPHITISSSVIKGEAFSKESSLASKNYYHLSVTDNGIGFDQQYSSRIFKVFQKLHGKQEYEGTGIGLAIVKKIIDNHSGSIVATGALNEGATFDMYIPADLPISNRDFTGQ